MVYITAGKAERSHFRPDASGRKEGECLYGGQQVRTRNKDLNDENKERRILNFIDDVRRLQIPKIEQIEKELGRSSAVAWAGFVLGIVGVAIGGFVLWSLYA